VLPPVLVREEAMIGTGFFPTEKTNIYELEQDGLFLTGTSEVALAAMHMTEILEAGELPLRYAGFSTCFRREAGAAGRTREDVRMHQFNKVEMFVFTTPDDAWAEHDRMVALEEDCSRSSGFRTASSTSRRATSAHQPRRRSTSRRGSRRRSATAR
jgi:seryl-tRNA synthetase